MGRTCPPCPPPPIDAHGGGDDDDDNDDDDDGCDPVVIMLTIITVVFFIIFIITTILLFSSILPWGRKKMTKSCSKTNQYFCVFHAVAAVYCTILYSHYTSVRLFHEILVETV